jgi:hypothetical protein
MDDHDEYMSETTVPLSELRKVRMETAKYRKEMEELRHKIEAERKVMGTIESINYGYGVVFFDKKKRMHSLMDTRLDHIGEMLKFRNLKDADSAAEKVDEYFDAVPGTYARVISLKGVEE